MRIILMFMADMTAALMVGLVLLSVLVVVLVATVLVKVGAPAWGRGTVGAGGHVFAPNPRPKFVGECCIVRW